MTALDTFKLNSHTIYYNNESRITFALNLLLFAEKQFHESFIMQNLDGLKIICEESLEQPPTKETLSEFINNGIIDTVKISICFENYFKAVLLAKGYLIHDIDSQVYRLAAKIQKKKPLLIEEFPGGFYDNLNIKTENKLIQQKYYGLKDQTEDYSVILTKQKYLEIINIEDNLVQTLIELNDSKSSLHTQNSLSFNLKPTSYTEFKALFDFVEFKIKDNKKILNDYLSGDNTEEPLYNQVI